VPVPSQRRIENGFPVEYRSDVDGDRHIIVAIEDADLTGWKIEVGPDEAWYRHVNIPVPDWREPRIVTFTTDLDWYRESKAGPWFHHGYNKDEPEYPWSAMVDHGERIIRWIPPDDGVR
jgi:hypothetical protein